ncbi:MAG: TRL-like family protein [Muribaculaceae bacterium]|nr:TRL-like family protein [Muribaculaceae bacterium]
MKKIVKSVAMAALLSFVFTSCAVVPSKVGLGWGSTDLTEGEMVTSNQIGTKVGTARATNILGLVCRGNASIEEAARRANIKRISHVDSHKTTILGVYSTYEVIVYGE